MFVQSNSQGTVAPTEWLTMREACERFKVHPNTLRNADKAGRLKAYRVNGSSLSHRRFREADVLQWLGIVKQGSTAAHLQDSSGVPVALVGRVSTAKQADDLKRQVERLEAYANERWGASLKLTKYVRTASGLNYEHPGLLKLTADVCSGRFRGGFLLVTHRERLIRFGFKLLEQLCSLNGVTIVCVEADPAKSDHEELVADLLAITHVFSCKHYGKRGGRKNRMTLSDELTAEIAKLSGQGFSIRYIFGKLKQQDRNRDVDGNSFSFRIVQRVVARAKAGLGAILSKVDPDNSSASPTGSFAAFWRAKVRLSTDGVKLARSKLLRAYRAWCEQNGQTAIGPKSIAAFLRRTHQSVVDGATETPSGEVLFNGLSLLNH